MERSTGTGPGSRPGPRRKARCYDSLTAWIRARRADGGAGLPDGLKPILAVERSKRTEAQKNELLAQFVEHGYSGTRSVFDPLHAELAKAEQERSRIDGQIPTTLVFRERGGEPKPAFLLNRGEYDQRRDKVGRATPAFLPPLPPGAPLNRLGLARWLVAPNHPLTARVAVNRFWLQVFGTGLVKTAEDFGSQGEPPSHPELLDWLAVQFREDGWDVKRFMKRLVMSATYRRARASLPRAWPETRPTGCSGAARGFGSTPRSFAIRPFSSAACLSSGSADRASSRPSPRDCGKPWAIPTATRRGSLPTAGPRRSIVAAFTPSGSGPRRRPR